METKGRFFAPLVSMRKAHNEETKSKKTPPRKHLARNQNRLRFRRSLAATRPFDEDCPRPVLGRCRRERWQQQIKSAKALVPVTASPATPTILEAVAESMQARGERHVGRVASLTEKLIGTFERLPEEEQLRLVAELERVDKIGRKAFGIADPSDGTPFVAVSVLNQW